MAVGALTDTQNVPLLFQQKVLLNVRYWQKFVDDKRGDVAAFDRKREQIVNAITFGLAQAEAWPEASNLFKDYAPHLERRGFWKDWAELLERAIAAASQANDTGTALNLTIQLARLATGQGNFDLAIDYYQQVIRQAGQAGNRYQQARAYSNLGYLYAQQANWVGAETMCRCALGIFEKLDSAHGRAHTENHLGLLYFEHTEWEKARQHLERACTIWESMGDLYGLHFGQINLGLLCNEIKKPDQALTYLENAQRLTEEIKADVAQGKVFIEMGVAYRLKGEPARAEAYAGRAEQIFRRFSNLRVLSVVWNNLGLACLDQGKWAEARQYFETVQKTQRQLKNRNGELRSRVYLVEYELARGNWRQASEQVRQLETLIDPQQNPRLAHYLQSVLAQYQHELARAA